MVVLPPTCNESERFNMTPQYNEDIMKPWTKYGLEILGSECCLYFSLMSFDLTFYKDVAYPRNGQLLDELSGPRPTALNYDCENAPLLPESIDDIQTMTLNLELYIVEAWST